MKYQDILDFWFATDTQAFWFAKSTDFDQNLTNRFQTTLKQAAASELWRWRTSAQGRLAEIIILDQFSRNIYRDTAQAFAQDAQALSLAQEAIHLELDQHLKPEYRRFLYMPFMHSESKLIHQQGLALFSALGDANSSNYELKHKQIIDRFGRYPHRNAILGRSSTPEELEFLQQPNSSF
jgi:uncharacterized protein (DUF924 family)